MYVGFLVSKGKEQATEMKCDCVKRLVTSIFRKLGFAVGMKPGYFIIAPVILSTILATGVLWLRYENDIETLYSPINGLGKEERRVVEALFPMNLSKNFDVGRRTRWSPSVQILIEARNGKSVFEKEVFSDIQLIDHMVKNVTILYDKREWRYQDICARKKGKCFSNDVLAFGDQLDSMERGIYSIDYPLMINNRTFQVFFSAAVLGEVKTDNVSKITSARALTLFYFLENEGLKEEEKAHMWEKAIVEMMKYSEFLYVKTAHYTSLSLVEEAERNLISIIPLFSITIIIMIVFSSCSCMMLDCVKSKPWLGFMGFISSITAVAGAFGLIMHCRLEFISLNLAAPFLMIGIGMDDTFVLLAAWRRTNSNLSVPERMSMAYADAGVSVTITSLTNFLSFCIGVITPYPSIRIFCTYTAVSVLFTYLYHITFFGGFMTLCGRLEQRNLHSLICIRTTPKSLAHSRRTCFKLFCTGGTNPMDPNNPQDNQEQIAVKFFRDHLGNLLSRKSIKAGVIVVFLTYLSLAFWGCTQIKEGFEWHKLTRYDSPMMQFHELRTKYFTKFPYRIQVVINQTLNYADPQIQQEVEDMLDTVENNKYMAGPLYTESWLRVYLRFLKHERSQVFLRGYNMSTKEDFYRGMHKVFFKLSRDYYKQDIKFNEDFTEITASRFVLQSMNIVNGNDELNMLRELRSLAAKAPMAALVFNDFFPFFDHYLLVKRVTLQAVGVATAVMMLITFLFINSSCALWVAVSIVSIEIGLIGYMSWWEVNLDATLMMNIIICAGFSVDFSAHITYAYISVKETDPKKRLRSALQFMGLPIAQGCITTIIGITILNIAPSYMYAVFFKSIFLVMLFGAMHGLVFLPVFLSLTDILSARMFPSKVKNGATSPDYIVAKDTDIRFIHTGNATFRKHRIEPASIYPAEVEYSSGRYKSAESFTDNGDIEQSPGPAKDSKDVDGRCRGTVNYTDRSHGVHINSEPIDHAMALRHFRINKSYINAAAETKKDESLQT